MKRNRSSKTADQVALSRALESMKPPAVRACVDPVARDLLAPRYRVLTSNALLRVFAVRVMERLFPGHHGYVVARTRYIDDQLGKAIENGIDQLVILGAGYDSRAYRFPGLDGSRVFEVDHPATQQAKQAKIRRALGALPGHVRYVAVDFGTDRLDERLTAQGYDRAAKTLFIWEGTTPYLSDAAVDDTLGFVASNSEPESRIVFDYILRSVLAGTCALPGALREARKMAKTDEPFSFGIEDETVRCFLEERGFREVEEADARLLAERYFSGRSDAPPIKPWWRLVRAFVGG